MTQTVNIAFIIRFTNCKYKPPHTVIQEDRIISLSTVQRPMTRNATATALRLSQSGMHLTSDHIQ